MSSYSTESEFSSSSNSQVNADFTGELLNQKYLVIYPIGEGAFATVWMAYNIKNGNYYAVKIQNADTNDYGEDEIDILKKIQNINCEYINKMLDHFSHDMYNETYDTYDEHICMVFELLAGSIYDIMKNPKYKNGLSYKTTMNILKQVIEAMNVLHNDLNTIHTDIKPENILLCGVNNKTKEIMENFNKLNFNKIYKKHKGKRKKRKNDPLKTACDEIMVKFHAMNIDTNMDFDVDDHYMDEDNIRVKLSDFGNCCDINYKLYDIQTRHYRAPEIILEYPYDGKCDIWSLGCLIYELVTGEVLFEPYTDTRITKSKNHLYQIVCRFGNIPEELVNISHKKKVYYKVNGMLKNVNNVNFNPLSLDKHLTDKLSPKELKHVVSAIHHYCNYRPCDRDLSFKIN